VNNLVMRVATAVLAVCCFAALAVPLASASTIARPAHAVQRSEVRAPAIVGPLAGYLWSELIPSYDYDSTAGTISVADNSTGNYMVTLDGLGTITGGMVQVTPYDASDTCAVEGWGPSGSALDVGVLCYTLKGKPVNALFDLIVTQPTAKPPGTFDYSWVYRDASSGKLTGSYQYNSAHKANSVRHVGVGRYQVSFGGPGASGTKGTVKVSAYGPGAGDCATSGWHGNAKGIVVDVSCFAPSGSPVNRDFDVTYASRTNLMGLEGLAGLGFPTANALISASGKVETQFNSQHKAHVTTVHAKRGLYQVELNGTTEADGGGDVQVSPVTSSRVHCTVVDWVGGPHVKTVVTVSCFNVHRHATNSAFTIQFVEAYLVV
jgi:hypothetical protein